MHSATEYWESDDLPGAQTRWSGPQRAIHLGLLLGLIACGLIDLATCFVLLSLGIFAVYGLVICVRVFAAIAGLLGQRAIEINKAEGLLIPDDDLPVYTILLPVYHEAGIIPDLINAIAALDYPSSKLDAKLLIEDDDHETARAARDLVLPPGMEVVMVPHRHPKTKPRACNVGLDQARGDYLVVFDAEDRPEPDQLRKAVAAFARLSADDVCLQAHLNYYNSRRNVLTRWFTIEYTTWFDLYLPGLHSLRAPIPLGGTSNHFRIEALRALHGWDPYNVTEDCDLGMRIERNGWHTRILDSTTWEEAVGDLGPWIRQRSRWLKGYWQTHLCHTRDAATGIRQLGLLKWVLMTIVVGGQVMSLLLNPVCWAIVGLWLVLRWPLYSVYHPATVILLIGTVAFALFNLFFVLVHLIGVERRRRHDLLPLVLLMPVYWILVSIGAWRGVLQFFTFPFKWEKTPHLGKAHQDATDHAVASAQLTPVTQATLRWRSVVLLLLVLALMAYVSWDTPRKLDLPRKFRLAAIRLSDAPPQHEVKLDASWFGRKELHVEIQPDWTPARTESDPIDIARVKIYMKVGDGEWFESVVDGIEPSGTNNVLVLDLPLNDGWTSVPSGLPWGPWCLRRIHAVGALVYGEAGRIGSIQIVRATSEGEAQRAPLLARVRSAPSRIERFEPATIRFSLGRTYQNPFDPEQIDAWGVFTAPDGTSQRVPAYYARDYRRTLRHAAELLLPTGVPYWAVRYCPRHAGPVDWHIEGTDELGDSFRTDSHTMEVAASDRRGFVRASADGRHFEFDNGDFYYPIGMNIRSPDDDKIRNMGPIEQPLKQRGSYVLENFLARMQAARIDMGRIWLMPSSLGLEWRRDWPGYHGMGVYNLQNAWRLEHLLDAAAAKKLYLEIAINQHGPFTMAYDSKWDLNPYNRVNGGPLARPQAVFTDPAAIKRFKNRYRYLAARYSSHPALFGWTMWIECNIVNKNPRTLRRWHSEMTRYLKSVDGGDHLVSTEFTSSTGMADVWSLPGITYVQSPQYNWGNGMLRTWEHSAHQLKRYGKPTLIEEFGGVSEGGHIEWLAHEFHDGPWLGWTLPISGTPMPWWWNLTFAYGLERHQRRFAQFVEGEDLRTARWTFGALRVSDAGRTLRARARYTSDRAYVWVYGTPTDVRYWTTGPRSQPQDGSRKYASLQGDFRSLEAEPGDIFDEISSARIDLAPLQLKPGDYSLEFWDTWSQAPPRRTTLRVTTGPTFLTLPPIRRDVAIKLIRTRSDRAMQ